MATIVTRAGKGSALTWTEGDANITNLNADKIENVVEDTTPQLGGALDVNGNAIISTSNGNIALSPDGSGKVVIDGYEFPDPLPVVVSGTVTATDSGTYTVTLSVSSGMLMMVMSGYGIKFFGSGVSSIGLSANTNYSINSVDSGNNTVTLMMAMGMNTVGSVSDVTFEIYAAASTKYLTFNGSVLDWTSITTPTLGSLDDVSVMMPSDGQVLTYDSTSSRWVNEAPSGGGSSTASLVTLTADNSTNATNYVTFVNAATGDEDIRTDTGLTYNPSTNTLTASTFSGNATTATTATNATNVTLVATNTTNSTHYPLFASAATGSVPTRTDTGLTYNPSTGVLTTQGAVLTGANAMNAPRLLLDGTTHYSTAWGTTGIGIVASNAIYRDTSSTGTVSAVYIHSLGSANLERANSGAFTNAATLYVSPPSAGFNTTITNGALAAFFDGAVRVGQNLNVDGGFSMNGAVGATSPNTGTFTTLTVNAGNELRLADSDSSNYVGFKSPATVTTNKVWTLPATDGTNGQVLSTNGSATLSWATAGGGGATFALATAQSALYTDGTSKNITWSENYDGGSFLSINGTTGAFTLTAGSYIVSLQGMGRIGNQGNGLEFRNVTGAVQISDMGYSFPWDGGATFMIPVGSFYLTPASSNSYVFRFTGNPSSTTITSTVLNLVIVKVA